MVDSTCYVPSPEGTSWREVGSGKQAKRGKHAEMQAAEGIKAGTTVAMFVQDGAPCENCHPAFRELSTKGCSYIFCISRGGYVVYLDFDKRDQLGGMHIPTDRTGRAKTLDYVIRNKWYKLDDDHLPAVIYFHNGTVFLDARPHDFPACPPLLAGYS